MGSGEAVSKRQRHETNPTLPTCDEVKKDVDLYLYSSIHLHGVELNSVRKRWYNFDLFT
jgi:hypothetical protein